MANSKKKNFSNLYSAIKHGRNPIIRSKWKS